MDANETVGDLLICPACGEQNPPDAVFCGNCGTSLRDDHERFTETPTDDDQATSIFEPIREPDHREEQPLWSPEPPREAIIDVDPGQTGAIPIQKQDHVTTTPDTMPPASMPSQATDSGIRGFVLGTLAIILIAVVIALYVYSAWLSDSARDTIDSWLPWAV